MIMFFKNLSIRYKILVPVALLGCLMFAMGIISLSSTKQIMEASEAISSNYAMKIERLGDITASYQTLRRVAFAHIVADNDELEGVLLDEADTLKSEITSVLRP